MEAVFEFILLFVFRYPGSFVLSLFSKKTFKELLKVDVEFVGIVGLLVVATPIVIVVNFIK